MKLTVITDSANPGTVAVLRLHTTYKGRTSVMPIFTTAQATKEGALGAVMVFCNENDIAWADVTCVKPVDVIV